MLYHSIILIRKVEKNFTTEQNRKRKKVRSVARFPVRVFFLPCRRDDAPIVVPASFLFPPSFCCVAVKDRKLPPPCNSSGLTALQN
ncbi:hypothetical protein IGI04_006427 [Brassica rapa subsp. trilocularis]|uniref:Uncharacterized protein n=1 Tax=Brassica rapa subsp. trilocularis TaxID=1813537 RepID=A0ABQ7NGX1_BRACM|nr:hypothetical protein IGI04_006427 [Brassica rapa subsp. trilocularis]